MAEKKPSPGTIFPTSDPEYSLTGDALRREQVLGGGVGTAPEPADGMKRYPTDAPPAARGARGGRSQVMWSAAGALAGAAAAVIGMKLARRR